MHTMVSSGPMPFAVVAFDSTVDVRLAPSASFDCWNGHPEFLHMHAQAIAIALAPTTADAPPNPDPMQAYRAYLGAVARRDFTAVVARMTEGCARQLFGSRDTPDFLALFELWCDSQCDPVVVTHSAVEHDLATIDVRSRHTTGRVTLCLAKGDWRVESERHQPLRTPAAR